MASKASISAATGFGIRNRRPAYIGKLDGNGRIPAEDTYYAALDLDDPDKELPDESFEFRGVMALGFRQFPNPWWPATRLYTLDFTSEDQRRQLYAQTPISVKIKRRRQHHADKLSEDLEIAEARTSPESGEKQVKSALVLRLQTLRDGDGYWLDTGILRQD